MAINTDPCGHRLQLTNVHLRPIRKDEEAQWDELMHRHHALGCPTFAGHRLKYVAEHRGQTIALLAFSAAAFHLTDRDRFIGWTPAQAEARRHWVVQNSRLLIFGEERRNLASRVLGRALKRLSTDWQQRFGYTPLLLETFVDPAQFSGTSYLAAGWQKVGRSQGFRRDAKDFYVADSSPKDIYLRPLRPDAGELLRATVLPPEWQAQEKPLPTPVKAKHFTAKAYDSLFERLNTIPDKRGWRGRRYPLACGLAIVVTGNLAGCQGLRECAEMAGCMTQAQLNAIRAWRNPKTGRREAPKHVTLWRMIRGVSAEVLEETLVGWLTTDMPTPGAIAIDGKALRATLKNADGGHHVVSAVAHAQAPLFSPKKSPRQKPTKAKPPVN